MKTIQRLSAAATAISITFSIVWAVAAYAYQAPGVEQAAAKLALYHQPRRQ